METQTQKISGKVRSNSNSNTGPVLLTIPASPPQCCLTRLTSPGSAFPNFPRLFLLRLPPKFRDRLRSSCLFKLLWTVPGLNFLCQSLSKAPIIHVPTTASVVSSARHRDSCRHYWDKDVSATLGTALTQNPNTWKAEAGGLQSYLMRPSLGERKGTPQSPLQLSLSSR